MCPLAYKKSPLTMVSDWFPIVVKVGDVNPRDVRGRGRRGTTSWPAKGDVRRETLLWQGVRRV